MNESYGCVEVARSLENNDYVIIVQNGKKTFVKAEEGIVFQVQVRGINNNIDDCVSYLESGNEITFTKAECNKENIFKELATKII